MVKLCKMMTKVTKQSLNKCELNLKFSAKSFQKLTPEAFSAKFFLKLTLEAFPVKSFQKLTPEAFPAKEFQQTAF